MRLLLGLLRPGALADEPAEVAGPTAALWPDHAGGEVLVAPLSAGDEQLGLVCAVARERGRFSPEHAQLLRSVADQTAVALQKAELIERLTAANVVKDLLEALAQGSFAAARTKAGEVGIDLARPHVVVQFDDAPDPPRLETALRSRFPPALVDVRPGDVRAVVPLGEEATPDSVRHECGELAEGNGVPAGLSGVLSGEEDSRRGLREAADAARVAAALVPSGGVVTYDELGAYKYLVRLGSGDAPHDRHRDAIERVLAYDARRRTSLAVTLEEFVAQRGNVAAAARALFVHPNTLRQRLERIEQVSGLDAQHEDLLALELALKVVRLQRAGEGW
jgi:sugar diacid utilization regulator